VVLLQHVKETPMTTAAMVLLDTRNPSGRLMANCEEAPGGYEYAPPFPVAAVLLLGKGSSKNGLSAYQAFDSIFSTALQRFRAI
jgi:hypothetical protein